MNDENVELFKLASWILVSSYRNRVMIALGNKLKTPSVLSRESGVKTNHISKTLGELKNKKLIECINEEANKGRLYQTTALGHKVMQKVKIIAEE